MNIEESKLNIFETEKSEDLIPNLANDHHNAIFGSNLWDLIKFISSTNNEEISTSAVDKIENGMFFSVLKKSKQNSTEIDAVENLEHKTLQVFS